jgi:NADH dehydrogenase FAD-containing subunit
VVVLGTGWAAASLVKKLDLGLYDVTVVSPRNYFLFTPMLAGTTVGTVEHRSIVEPIRSLLMRTGAGDAEYIQAECTAIDPKANTITCKVRPLSHPPLSPARPPARLRPCVFTRVLRRV